MSAPVQAIADNLRIIPNRINGALEINHTTYHHIVKSPRIISKELGDIYFTDKMWCIGRRRYYM